MTHAPTADVLMQLTGHAMLSFLGSGEGLEARVTPGLWMCLSGEPVADLNYLIATADAPGVAERFRACVRTCDERDLPFAAMLGPALAEPLAPVCTELGLVHAVAWPLMVCPGSVVDGYRQREIDVRTVACEDEARASTQILSAAFSMPFESVARATPLAAHLTPGISTRVAYQDGRATSTVSATVHGRVVGIWAMGTLPDAQGQGVGKALLEAAMREERERGAEAFFLGATPAGLRLYESLGYETLAEAQVWVRGTTHQA